MVWNNWDYFTKSKQCQEAFSFKWRTTNKGHRQRLEQTMYDNIFRFNRTTVLNTNFVSNFLTKVKLLQRHEQLYIFVHRLVKLIYQYR